MDVYSPGPVTRKVSPPASPALSKPYRQDLEKTYSGTDSLAYAPCRECQQREFLRGARPIEDCSPSSTLEGVYDLWEQTVAMFQGHEVMDIRSSPPKWRNSPPEITRARMDSDTLPYITNPRNRNSSVYSIDSAFSTETKDTTISDIVDMYNDVTTKKTSDEQIPVKGSGGPIHGAQSYRDTLVPLLQRRFSSDLTRPTLEIPHTPQEQTSPTNVGPQQWQYLQGIDGSKPSKDIPSFIDFSRKLQNRKMETNSPVMLVISSGEESQTGKTAMSAAGHNNRTLVRRDHSNPSPTADDRLVKPSWLLDNEMMPQPLNLNHRKALHDRRDHQAPSSRVTQLTRDCGEVSIGTNTYDETHAPTRGRQLSRRRSPESPYIHQHQMLRSVSQKSSANRSTAAMDGTYRTQSLGRRARSSGPQRSRLQKKDRRTSEEKTEMARAASAKRTASARRPGREVSWSEPRRNSMKVGINDIVRRLSTRTSDTSPMPPLPQQPVMHAAIPLTPYQLQGPKAFEQEFKLELKEEKRRAKEDLKLEKARRSFEKKATAGHHRTASARSINSIGGIFEGWRHSLTRSASERRRDKLKASIVVVGPAVLTAENNAFPDGGVI